MLLLRHLAGPVSWQSNIPVALSTLLVLLLLSVTGCTNDGAGGPIISSLAAPTDGATGLDSDQANSSKATDTADSDGEEDPTISMTSTPTGVTAHVTWAQPPDMNVAGYNIYYRKQPLEESRSEESTSEEPSSCSSGESQTVQAPPASITGLEPNTPYVFAVRAFNESESLCSNEITVVTPPAES